MPSKQNNKMTTLTELSELLDCDRCKVDNVKYRLDIKPSGKLGRVNVYSDSDCNKIRIHIEDSPIIQRHIKEITVPLVATRRLMTVREVGEFLCLSQRSVYRLASLGKIPRPVKVGGSRRWLLSELETFEWAH